MIIEMGTDAAIVEDGCKKRITFLDDRIEKLEAECRHFQRQFHILIKHIDRLGSIVQKHERDIELRLLAHEDGSGSTKSG